LAIEATLALSSAAIPEPGVILYGKVTEGANLITRGEITWTYTPTAGGSAVVAATPLAALSNQSGEDFSYVINIPAHCCPK
jgi:hypothetical protein